METRFDTMNDRLYALHLTLIAGILTALAAALLS